MQGSGELAGKVLFVAGVGPLIGSATAQIAAREGARVALAARGRAHPEAIARQIRDAGGEAIALQCDLADRASITAAVTQASAALGTIDRVFYNAGYYDNGHSSIEVDEQVWQMAMDINYNGAHWLARAVMPGMLENGNGAFVFNSSAASLVAGQVRFGYQVSKAGLNALTRFIAANYGRRGIRANATLPFVAGGQVGQVAAELNCIGRSGTAEEIGEAIVFLLSDRASMITGQVIHLDGGLFARAAW
ncbi:MAG: SDR family oxidoreductase, partial [Novosphingobium sp.]|nr:SDR family oxidoreductase [Novosphingobium sp.]